ncbi:hypothetical protein B11447_03870 [Campylobacter jejuni]|nr:hypothetical protein B11447_03870 [Campylobacter jejuni]
MAVKITDICIACGSCIDECPVSAIVDDANNPDIMFMQTNALNA